MTPKVSFSDALAKMCGAINEDYGLAIKIDEATVDSNTKPMMEKREELVHAATKLLDVYPAARKIATDTVRRTQQALLHCLLAVLAYPPLTCFVLSVLLQHSSSQYSESNTMAATLPCLCWLALRFGSKLPRAMDSQW